MMTVKEVHNFTTDKLKKAGIETPAFNSLCLIERVFGLTQTDLITNGDAPADDSKIPKLNALTDRRIKGEPLQYILEEWEFYGYPLKVGKGVLIPRDDTEVVLRACLEYLKNIENPKVLDLCSGSGAIAIALAKETNADVVAVEKSPLALSYLKENVKLNNASVQVVQGDIFNCMSKFSDKSFDLIVSNPPYIKADEIQSLQIEVSYEPQMALDGGNDGCDFYRHIVKHWSGKLRYGGLLAFELGEGQFNYVKGLMEAQGFRNISESLDFSGIQRVIKGTLL